MTDERAGLGLLRFHSGGEVATGDVVVVARDEAVIDPSGSDELRRALSRIHEEMGEACGQSSTTVVIKWEDRHTIREHLADPTAFDGEVHGEMAPTNVVIGEED